MYEMMLEPPPPSNGLGRRRALERVVFGATDEALEPCDVRTLARLTVVGDTVERHVDRYAGGTVVRDRVDAVATVDRDCARVLAHRVVPVADMHRPADVRERDLVISGPGREIE